MGVVIVGEAKGSVLVDDIDQVVRCSVDSSVAYFDYDHWIDLLNGQRGVRWAH